MRETDLDDVFEARRRLTVFYDHCSASGVPELERLGHHQPFGDPDPALAADPADNAPTEGTNLIVSTSSGSGSGSGTRQLSPPGAAALRRTTATSRCRTNTTPPPTHPRGREPDDGRGKAAE